MTAKQLVLASGSPRRAQLLQNIGATFEVMISHAEETFDPSLPPHLIVEELSLLKANSVAKQAGSGKLIIGADTVVVLDGVILGKPQDAQDAKDMLQSLSGKTHHVLTGFSLVDSDTLQSISDYADTTVHFRKLTEEEIDRYVQTGEPLDKAGAYGIQELGSMFVTGIEGDFFNVMGLPICKLCTVLKSEWHVDLL